MKRIRTMLVALVGALALTASVGAASASASAFFADEATATITSPFASVDLTLGGISWHCLSKLEGELKSPTSSVTSGVNIASCERPSVKATGSITSNGCKLIFHPGAGSSGTFKGTFEIGPTGCGPMKFSGSNGCKGNIPSQAGLAASYVNVTEGGKELVEVQTGTSLKWEGESSPLICGKTTGSLSVSWKMKALNKAGGSIGIHVDHPGVYLSGNGFDAEVFPVRLSGSQNSSHVINRANRTVDCDFAAYEQAGTLSGPATQLLVQPTFAECTAPNFGGAPATVETNGCLYSLDVLNLKPPYTGEMSVSCPEGKAIVIRLYASQKNYESGTPTCVFEIRSQKGLDGASYSTVGEGIDRGINVDLQLNEVTSIKTLGTILNCAGVESKTTTFTSSATLFDVN